MRRALLILVCIALQAAGTVLAESNWRVHGKICAWDENCMRSQAKAQDLWMGGGWDKDLKEGCRRAHIKTYAKDYIAAVNCISPLQQRRLKEREEAEAASRRGSSGSSGRVLSGGKIISY